VSIEARFYSRLIAEADRDGEREREREREGKTENAGSDSVLFREGRSRVVGANETAVSMEFLRNRTGRAARKITLVRERRIPLRRIDSSAAKRVGNRLANCTLYFVSD
jgi:hypothetical protein